MNDNKANRPRTPTVETLGPVSRKKSSRKSRILIPAVSLLLVFGLAGGVYALKSGNYKELSNSQVVAPKQEVSPPDAAKVAEQSKIAEELAAQEKKTQSQRRAKSQQPIVIYEPEGVFSEQEKKELNGKLLGPMIDYQPASFTAIIIELYSQDKFVNGVNDDKYIVTTIGKAEAAGHGSFLYGSKKNGLQYWKPQCLNNCQFSDEFIKKYPEIVKQYQD